MAVLLPPTLVVTTYFILGEVYFAKFANFGLASLVGLPIIAGIWILQGKLAKKLLSIYPDHRDTPKRVLLFSSINLLIVAITVTLICLAFHWLKILDYEFTVSTWITGLIAGFICTIVNQAVYETDTSFGRIRVSQLEAEQLKKAQLQTQFDSLKEQVSPHFLFNSLNSLSSLIATDPVRAEEFVEEMSRVYRYLLRSNEEHLTTLKKEIAFIESYIVLLQTRFGSGFQPVITIPEEVKEYLLPPMTLQLLIENAVKHNIVDPDMPLTVELYVQGEKLIVSNNLQKKNKTVISNKVGLNNIISKYRLLNSPEVEIRETPDAFTVVLPLIKNIH
jgi:sensor histidine kinase YesM